MSFGEHLLELRKRVYISAAAIVAGMIGGWFLSDFLLTGIRQPIADVAESQGRIATLNFDSITSAFDLRLQIALTIGIIISSPVWLFQIWAFFVPGMTRREVRYAIGFFFSAVPLFLAGCAAGWHVFPHIVELMTSFAPQDDASIITAKTYFDFVLKLTIVVGVAFVLPVFLVLLNFAGVMSAKAILKGWRIAILLITLFTAIATPAADVLSMFLLAIPMVGLYFLAAAIAWAHDARRERKIRKQNAEQTHDLPSASEKLPPAAPLA
jgi:sec-independent protein translocase protein TatC